MASSHTFDILIAHGKHNPSVKVMFLRLPEEQFFHGFFQDDESLCIPGELRDTFGFVRIDNPRRDTAFSQASGDSQADKIPPEDDGSRRISAGLWLGRVCFHKLRFPRIGLELLARALSRDPCRQMRAGIGSTSNKSQRWPEGLLTDHPSHVEVLN